MSARAIFDSLQTLSAAAPEDAARAGFLEWAFGLPEDSVPRAEACAALRRIGGLGAHSAAARAFVGLLEEAALWPAARPARRGGRAGRKRSLH